MIVETIARFAQMEVSVLRDLWDSLIATVREYGPAAWPLALIAAMLILRDIGGRAGARRRRRDSKLLIEEMGPEILATVVRLGANGYRLRYDTSRRPVVMLIADFKDVSLHATVRSHNLREAILLAMGEIEAQYIIHSRAFDHSWKRPDESKRPRQDEQPRRQERAKARADSASGSDKKSNGWTAGWSDKAEWWTVLGIPKNASVKEVQKAHRLLAKKMHPDLGGSTSAMSRINAARDEALAHLR